MLPWSSFRAVSRDDWYRNESWGPEIADSFEQKLQRARAHNKAQYLKIQAGCLATTDPEVALLLLDRYFESGDTFFLAPAYEVRATALVALGRIDEAIGSYDAALLRETEFSSVRTRAFLDLPYLVATHPLPVHFARVAAMLRESWDQLLFPVDRFMANASLALISESLSPGSGESVRHAAAALEAASQEESGFRYHKGLGLVGGDHAAVLATLRRLVAGGSDESQKTDSPQA